MRALKVCSFVSVFVSLVVSASSSATQVELKAASQADCFLEDKRLGFKSKPLCEVEARTPWGNAYSYKLNEDGFRGSPAQKSRDPKSTRIMLIGPGAEGVGLGDTDTLEGVLSRQLILGGLKNVEVINAATPGYFAPHYEMVAVDYQLKYRPDIVVYFHSSDQIKFDFLEKRLIKYDPYGDAIQFNAAGPVAFNNELKLIQILRSLYSRSKTYWKLYWNTKSEIELQRRFMEPTFQSLIEIRNRFGPQTQFLVVTAPRSTTNSNSIKTVQSFLGFFVNFVTPEIKIYINQSLKEFRRRDINALVLERQFAKGEDFDLIPTENPMAYTKTGIEKVVENLHPKIVQMIETEGQGLPEFYRVKTK